MEKGYIVLTPEKIEDIFRDLEEKIIEDFQYTWMDAEERHIKSTLESKKQELLKQLTK